MYEHFNEVFVRFTSSLGLNSVSDQPRSTFDKVSPFKVQINLDLPNLEGKIYVDSVDDWIQQLECHFFVNQLSKAEKVTIASLKMLTSMHCQWENLLNKREKITPSTHGQNLLNMLGQNFNNPIHKTTIQETTKIETMERSYRIELY